MGFFSFLFGTGTRKPRYDQTERPLSHEMIRKLVSRIRVKSLDAKEEKIVEEALIKRKGNDGKISLFQVDDVLAQLQRTRQISEFDRKGVMRDIERYFEEQWT